MGKKPKEIFFRVRKKEHCDQEVQQMINTNVRIEEL